MIQYVLYKNPLDFPGRFVVRRWHIDGTAPGGFRPDQHVMANCKTLEGARMAIRKASLNAVCIPRHPTDDPTIREVWI